MPDLHTRLACLPLWPGPIEIEPLAGGMTNRNLLIHAPQGRFVARVAGNNAAHAIDRAAEQAATRAAARAGLGPELVWAEPDLMILRHIEGHTLRIADLAQEAMLRKTVDLLRDTWKILPLYYQGPMPDRRPLAMLGDYADRLLARPGRWHQAVAAYRPLLAALAPRLAGVPAGFAHNDIHGDNLIDDGDRLWLVDWEYAGQGQPLADIASLANNALMAEEAAASALGLWLGRPAAAEDFSRFAAMRLATALRDLFWGYAQDSLAEPGQASLVDYIAINEDRVRAAVARL